MFRGNTRALLGETKPISVTVSTYTNCECHSEIIRNHLPSPRRGQQQRWRDSAAVSRDAVSARVMATSLPLHSHRSKTGHFSETGLTPCWNILGKIPLLIPDQPTHGVRCKWEMFWVFRDHSKTRAWQFSEKCWWLHGNMLQQPGAGPGQLCRGLEGRMTAWSDRIPGYSSSI